MKLKKEYIILLLVIAALCAYLATRSKDQTHFELPKLAKVENSRIDRLNIVKNGTTIELTKKDERWYVGPKAYAADDIKLKNMVQSAAGLVITALASESGSYERYGLTDDKKISVQAYGGKTELRSFTIGGQAPTQQHTFVRVGDDPNVYHARGSINFTYDHSVEDLRDKTVLSYDRGDITALTIVKGDQARSVTRKEVIQEKDTGAEEKESRPSPEKKMQWSDADGRAAKQADVELLIGAFTRLKNDGFLEDNAGDDLKDPIWTITLNAGEKAHTLSVFNPEGPEDQSFPAISSGTPYAFKLQKSRIQGFEKNIDKLLNPEAAK